ncbi:MAG: hypothetical protein KGI78_01050 [Patescibacteria group bacterium]|nr:hypothetical protein [Patescibacteria group bacterium]MDE1943892.1 hypothetical protein [Patescibacteria group bacterium]MDE1945184.1 hypothetical protein [Patescibacteria group bacterium]MDE2057423.1 hypothetical protein [Patescibacteria group bacterium]
MSLFAPITEKAGLRLQKWPLFSAGLAILLVAAVFAWGMVATAFSLALFLAPLWLPVLVLGAAWTLWVNWRRSEFLAKQDYVLLEIKPPRSVERTPLAMETVIDGLHLDPGESNWYAIYVKGATRPLWSLELASLGGQVHFYIRARTSFRRQVETQVYAQYPGAQVVEAPDYTRMVHAPSAEWEVFGCDYKHTNKDPYPIRTYVEFGLDKPQKEPEQTDPLANLIEFLGSLGPHEQLWIQMVLRVHKGEKYEESGHTWRDEANQIIEKIRKDTRSPYNDPNTGKEMPGFPNPTKGQSEAMAAIERNIAKQAFDVGIRAIYLGEHGHFNGATIPGMKGLFKQVSSNTLNGITWTGGKGLLGFNDYPWEFSTEKMKEELREEIVDAYRRRQCFYPPHAREDYMVMSSEELATIFHIPSRAVETPSLERIPSATSEAPGNLPV